MSKLHKPKLKKHYFICFFTLLLFSQTIHAQSLSVSSFRKLDNSMTARIDAPKKDKNGDACALIKIVTNETGFSFEGDGAGIFASEYKTAEYWVWIGYGAKRITIKHPKHGILRDFQYPIPIEKATDYELVLITGYTIPNLKKNEIESQWLIINTDSIEADVYINDQPVGKTPYQNELPVGKYTWRLQKDLYVNEAGVVELIANAEKQIINIKLKSNYGSLQIFTKPENGASINLNGIPTGKKTPCLIEPLPAGEHTITASLEMYETSAKSISLSVGETKTVSFEMKPIYAEVSITTEPNADIYINNKFKARGKWEGRLNMGIYTFEAKLEKHTTAIEKQILNIGQTINLKLNPSPLTGAVKVISSPLDATIKIDGKVIGKTPLTIKNLLIGEYTLEISHNDYAYALEKLTIQQGETTSLNTTLEKGREVSITSNQLGIELFIDDYKVGITPYKGNLTIGEHKICIGKEEKKINITQSGGETLYNLSIKPYQIKDVDGNVYDTLQIGSQVWMKQNLKVTKYQNGDPIPNAIDDKQWKYLAIGSYCDYNNTPNTSLTYGRLYCFYTIVDPRGLCPKDWHVPADIEWTLLTDYLGGSRIAGDKLKEKEYNHWSQSTNAQSIEEIGFLALPGGCRLENAKFSDLKNYGYWWSSTEAQSDKAWFRRLNYYYAGINRNEANKGIGYSVRCLKDK